MTGPAVPTKPKQDFILKTLSNQNYNTVFKFVNGFGFSIMSKYELKRV